MPDLTIGPHPDSPQECQLDHSCQDDEMCSCWCELHDCPIANCPSYKLVTAWLAQARAEGVAAGRAQAAADIRAYAANYPEDVFPAGAESRDGIAGSAMRHAYLNAAKIAECLDKENTDA